MAGVTARAETEPVCPLCGGAAEPKPFYQSPDWMVVRCARCTFAWAIDLDAAPSSTAFTWGEDIVVESAAREPMYRDRVNRVDKYQPSPRTWLDVGCGGGGLLCAAAAAGFVAEGIELSPSADVITERFGIPVHKQPLREATALLRQPVYGVVSYFHVLEHVPEPVEELRAARAILGAESLMVVEVPFFDSIPWRVRGAKHRHFYRGHRSYFNQQSLRTILETTGFSVLEMGSVPYQMTADWLLRRLGTRASGLRRALPAAVLKRSVPINSGEYLLAISRLGSASVRQ